MWKLEFWELEIKFKNSNFENHLRIWVLKIKLWIGGLEISSFSFSLSSCHGKKELNQSPSLCIAVY